MLCRLHARKDVIVYAVHVHRRLILTEKSHDEVLIHDERMCRMMLQWFYVLTSILRKNIFLVGSCIVILAGIVFVIAGYCFKWDWTGFNDYTGPNVLQFQATKTLWDWMQLLIVPIILGIGGYIFNHMQKKRDDLISERRESVDREIASDNQREVKLQMYIDKMSELLLKRGLSKTVEDGQVRQVARAHTLTVLKGLDSRRKGNVLRFLLEAELIHKDKTIVKLNGADLRGADLGGDNLSGVNLRGTDLSEANLRGTILLGSDLSGAKLVRADLNGAVLSGAILSFADLSEADLRKDKLRGADLSGAILSKALLNEAILVGADLTFANLSNANLSGTSLCEVNLSGASLSEANLSGANLGEANLSGANLHEANLRGANLKDAILSGANLSGASLSEANLSGTTLKDIDLSDANLSGTALSKADANEH
jgi:uncharacterized protein YjbI with pentapeptide repeats